MSITETIAAFTIALLLRDAIRTIFMGVVMARREYSPERPFIIRVFKNALLCW